MTADGLRETLIGFVRTIASADQQFNYAADVPFINVVTELRCGWFDDLYHPDGNLFCEAFAPIERDRLAQFNAAFRDHGDRVPRTLEKALRSSDWIAVVAAARQTISDLEWGL